MRKASIVGVLLISGAFSVALCAHGDSTAAASPEPTKGRSAIMAPGAASIMLAKGEQLARDFSAERVRISLLSRPFFQASAGDWPTLEVGPSSLVFVQDASGGGLILLGDGEQALPVSIELGADGRSKDLLGLSLEYDRLRGEAALQAFGKTYAIEASPDSHITSVVITAGAADWVLEKLEFESNEPASVARVPNLTAATTPGNRAKPESIRLKRQLALQDAIAFFGRGQDAAGEAALDLQGRGLHGTAAWRLDCANRLTWVALELSRRGEASAAVLAAQKAVDKLRPLFAANQRSEATVVASASELEGFLVERFFGDLEQARASYSRAAGVMPGSVVAEAAIGRLERAEQESRIRAKR
ncbi:MAG: hypothetical protein Q8M02_15565 [Candidatus Didemnitutus sp.]|nr:hypothetical protein [Candidatus Didemnitutus sp.]